MVRGTWAAAAAAAGTLIVSCAEDPQPAGAQRIWHPRPGVSRQIQLQGGIDTRGRLLPFVRRRKAVFHIEYRVRPRQFCARARRMRFSSVYKRLSLGVYRVPC